MVEETRTVLRFRVVLLKCDRGKLITVQPVRVAHNEDPPLHLTGWDLVKCQANFPAIRIRLATEGVEQELIVEAERLLGHVLFEQASR